MDDHNYAEPVYIATPLCSLINCGDTKPDGTQECSPREDSKKISKSKRICCVPECHTTGYDSIEGHGKPSYHVFPDAGNPLRAVWLTKIRRDEDRYFQIRSHTVVCSLHFEAKDVEISGFSKRRYLKPGAVPTIFECWKIKPHLYKQSTPRAENSLQKRRQLNFKNDTPVKSEVSHSNEEIVTDHTHSSSNEPANTSECTGAQVEQTELQNHFLVEHFRQLQKKIDNLEHENAKLKAANDQLENEKATSMFCIESIKQSEFLFYTGFSSKDVFDAVLTLVNPGERGENIILISQRDDESSVEVQKVRKPRKLSPANQFFLFLCRVRVGMFENDLARRFNVSIGTVSTIITSWANFLYLRLGSMNIWPTRTQIDETMPSSFKQKYPSTRVIIDCTEIKVEMASSLLVKSQTYSNYKSANTLKGLIGIAPCGSITFISQLYHGSISDREITLRSGFFNLSFEPGDSVMADKGFDIQDLLDDKSVRLNVPPFLGQYGQMTGEEVRLTQSIAAERIHVERAINKIKNFHIFDQVLPVSLFGSVNQIWTVCALLTLFQDPIISCPGV